MTQKPLRKQTMQLLCAMIANPGLNITEIGRTANLSKIQAHQRARTLENGGYVRRGGLVGHPTFAVTAIGLKIANAFMAAQAKSGSKR